MTDILAKLAPIFQEVFDDDELEITPVTTADDIEDWDSLEHINLIIAVEKAFGIKFTTAEISRLKEPEQNVGTFSDLIASKMS